MQQIEAVEQVAPSTQGWEWDGHTTLHTGVVLQQIEKIRQVVSSPTTQYWKWGGHTALNMTCRCYAAANRRGATGSLLQERVGSGVDTLR